MPTICLCKRFNAYNYTAPYAFLSTLLQKILTQTNIKLLWAFLDRRVNWMLVAVKLILYACFVSDAIRRRIKKYNHHQQIPSSASHFFAKDSMLVQSRWLHKPFVTPLCLCLWRATYSTLLITHPPWLCY